MIGNIKFIAEVKTSSPFGFKSDKSWEELFEIANKYGDMISIHTDKKWGGSFDHVKRAKNSTQKQILAKGIHKEDSDVEKAIAAGADYVLVVGRIPKVHLNKVFIEPLNLEELKKIPRDIKVVWNSRDLKTGGIKKETFEDARKIFQGWMCQASYIKSMSDVNVTADAILVGSHLEEFVKTL